MGTSHPHEMSAASYFCVANNMSQPGIQRDFCFETDRRQIKVLESMWWERVAHSLFWQWWCLFRKGWGLAIQQARSVELQTILLLKFFEEKITVIWTFHYYHVTICNFQLISTSHSSWSVVGFYQTSSIWVSVVWMDPSKGGLKISQQTNKISHLLLSDLVFTSLKE